MKSWYAVYTRPRAEKKVKDELDYLGIECYVPLRKTLRQWSDRKKWIEVPVINGYAFVNIERSNFGQIVRIINVVKFVSFEGQPVRILDEQIKNLKIMLQEAETISVNCENYAPGEKVEIITGPMKGFKGEVIRDQKKFKIILRLQQLGMNITAEVNKNILQKI